MRSLTAPFSFSVFLTLVCYRSLLPTKRITPPSLLHSLRLVITSPSSALLCLPAFPLSVPPSPLPRPYTHSHVRPSRSPFLSAPFLRSFISGCWRGGAQIGWLTGPKPLVAAAAKAHQFLTFTVASSLQRAVAYGLEQEQSFFLCAPPPPRRGSRARVRIYWLLVYLKFIMRLKLYAESLPNALIG